MDRLINVCRVYEPQILKTMGIAFDAAWDVLSKDCKNRGGERLRLSRIIFRLVDAKETNALQLCRLALSTFKQSDVQRAKKNAQLNLVAWVGVQPAPDRIGWVPHLLSIVMVIFVVVSSPALAQMSRGECAALVPSALQSVKDLSLALERLDQPLRQRDANRAPDADAELALEQARMALLEPFRKYRNAYQDLAFQLQRCAR